MGNIMLSISVVYLLFASESCLKTNNISNKQITTNTSKMCNFGKCFAV